MAGLRLHGIVNCDTVRRARSWLGERGVDHDFHDFRRAGVPLPELDRWLDAVGWQRLLNRRGTTWRRLDAAQRDAVHDAVGARALLLAQPSLIKRPVAQWPDGSVSVGFDADDWARQLAKGLAR
ncbi:MAG TPA: ArsC family reductase [Rubrivivax sp.]|nr:ArsC family reductase [Rubrivivax sp.]